MSKRVVRVLVVPLALLAPCSARAMERPTPEQIEQYRKDGSRRMSISLLCAKARPASSP